MVAVAVAVVVVAAAVWLSLLWSERVFCNHFVFNITLLQTVAFIEWFVLLHKR